MSGGPVCGKGTQDAPVCKSVSKEGCKRWLHTWDSRRQWSTWPCREVWLVVGCVKRSFIYWRTRLKSTRSASKCDWRSAASRAGMSIILLDLVAMAKVPRIERENFFENRRVCQNRPRVWNSGFQFGSRYTCMKIFASSQRHQKHFCRDCYIAQQRCANPKHPAGIFTTPQKITFSFGWSQKFFLKDKMDICRWFSITLPAFPGHKQCKMTGSVSTFCFWRIC